MKKGILLSVCACLMFLLGCQSKDGAVLATPPSITEMNLFNSSWGQLSFNLDFDDSGGDVSKITTNLYDEHSNLIKIDTSPVDMASGVTSGTIYGDLDFSSLTFGNYSVVVYLTDKGNAKSNTISRSFSAEGAFGKAVNYPNPSDNLFLGDTAIGDLNGDGRNDVAAIEYANNTGHLLIYYQNASGGLDNPVVMNLDIVTRGIAIADVNNDGKADLIISGFLKTNSFFTCIEVFLQDSSTGQLDSPKKYAVTSDSIFGLAVADLNADGKNDIVVMAGKIGAPGGISIFFQNIDGTLGPEVINNTPIKFEGEIHVADMNNDGLNDIVLQSGQQALSVIMQISPGIFSSTPDVYYVNTSYWPTFTAFALGDLNGDGRTDMVVANPVSSGYINIFSQNSQGKLDGPVLIQMSGAPSSIRVADITGDGLNDLVLPGIIVLPQQPDHSFGPQRYYQSSSFNTSDADQALSVGDLTGDGLLDAVVTTDWPDNGVYVYPYSPVFVVH